MPIPSVQMASSRSDLGGQMFLRLHCRHSSFFGHLSAVNSLADSPSLPYLKHSLPSSCFISTSSVVEGETGNLEPGDCDESGCPTCKFSMSSLCQNCSSLGTEPGALVVPVCDHNRHRHSYSLAAPLLPAVFQVFVMMTNRCPPDSLTPSEWEPPWRAVDYIAYCGFPAFASSVAHGKLSEKTAWIN